MNQNPWGLGPKRPQEILMHTKVGLPTKHKALRVEVIFGSTLHPSADTGRDVEKLLGQS